MNNDETSIAVNRSKPQPGVRKARDEGGTSRSFLGTTGGWLALLDARALHESGEAVLIALYSFPGGSELADATQNRSGILEAAKEVGGG